MFSQNRKGQYSSVGDNIEYKKTVGFRKIRQFFYSALLNLPLTFCQKVFFGGVTSAGPLKLFTLRM